MQRQLKFIEQIAGRIRDSFPEAKIRYEFFPRSQTYFIEVLPDSLFQSNEFAAICFEAIDAFMATFDECVCFICSDSLNKLSENADVL